jgi:hypothetical protein
MLDYSERWVLERERERLGPEPAWVEGMAAAMEAFAAEREQRVAIHECVPIPCCDLDQWFS